MTATLKKLDYITVLRAIAILLVLAVHTSELDSGFKFMRPYVQSIIGNGARGVQLFYLLSAFTLFHSFKQRSLQETTPVRNYFIRRFFRIAPLFYLAIIYYLWQDGTGPRYWLGDAKGISAANIVSNFLFVHGFNPYWINSLVFGGWSVSVEVSFYCLLPFLFYRIKNLQQACNFAMVALIFRLVLFTVFKHHILISDPELWNNYLFLYFPNQLPVFAFGIVLYFLIYGEQNISLSPKAIFIYSTFILLGLSIARDFFPVEIDYFAIIFLMLAYALHRYHPVLLFNRFFLYIGKISYTLYLTHWACIHFLTKYGIVNLFRSHDEPSAMANYFINYAFLLAASVLLSTIIFHTIEEPMQKLGGKIINRSKRRSLTPDTNQLP